MLQFVVLAGSLKELEGARRGPEAVFGRIQSRREGLACDAIKIKSMVVEVATIVKRLPTHQAIEYRKNEGW